MRDARDNVITNVVIPRSHKEMLQVLSRETRITQSEYLREAVEDLLRKYHQVFRGTPYASEIKGKRRVGTRG